MGIVEIELPFTAKDAETFLVARGFDVCLEGPPGTVVTGFSDPGDYHMGTAIWLGSAKYLKLNDGESRADVTLLFAASDFDAVADFPTIMHCADPRNAFMALVEACSPDSWEPGIHEAALVSPDAIIGERVFIGPNVVIEAGAAIGNGTRIDAGSVIRGCVVIGECCHIFPNCSIGSLGYGFRKSACGELTRAPHRGSVIIGNNAEIGACSVIDRGTFRDTVIGSGTKIDSLTNIGHNTQIGENCLIIGGAIGGNCTVGSNCEIIHACVKNRVTVGNNVKIGIGSVVLRDIDSQSECFGNPARVIARK